VYATTIAVMLSAQSLSILCKKTIDSQFGVALCISVGGSRRHAPPLAAMTALSQGKRANGYTRKEKKKTFSLSRTMENKSKSDPTAKNWNHMKTRA